MNSYALLIETKRTRKNETSVHIHMDDVAHDNLDKALDEAFWHYKNAYRRSETIGEEQTRLVSLLAVDREMFTTQVIKTAHELDTYCHERQKDEESCIGL